MVDIAELKEMEEIDVTEKVVTVLEELDKGTTRDELVEMLDYSGWKSIDTYMRRKGFRFDSEGGNFVPDVSKSKTEVDVNLSDSESKVDKIKALFAENDLGSAEIADEFGFEDHLELAEYMASEGYRWDSEAGNYIKDEDMQTTNCITEQKEEIIDEVNKTVGKVVHLDEDIVRLLEVYSLYSGVNEDKIVEEALNRHFNSNGFLEEIKSKVA